MRGWVRGLRALAAGVLLVSLWGCPNDNPDFPQTRDEAWRFLTQATFGPDEASITEVMSIGYTAWIDKQLAMKPTYTFRAFMAQRDADLKAAGSKAGPAQVMEAFYTRALTDKAQLRARAMFALSEIFVVSFSDAALEQTAPEMVAGFADMLEAGLDGNYRQLLENVSLSPAMGQYLTHRGNFMEVPSIGHYPDENYAREIMQLFSIGLHELNPDGTVKLNSSGKPTETYTNDDIKGLAKVFTGWSNYRGGSFASVDEGSCFAWSTNCRDPEGFYRPMVAYPAYHSVSDKTFLGVTVPAQSTPNPQASLKVALDRIASHPNVAPFFCKQLIQRLVTSNPTPAYVQRVAARFLETGGSLKDTIKAILLDEEARGINSQLSAEHGKLREPILRLTALLRAFKFESPTLKNATLPYVALSNTSDPGTSIGQAPFMSPSVFNFFRPGYVPQRDEGQPALVAPEMQLVNEATVVGYFNVVQDMLVNGIGGSPTSLTRNITLNFAPQRGLAGDPEGLVQHIADRLKGGVITEELRQTIMGTVESIKIPELAADNSNMAEVTAALNKRVWTAILLIAVSPEFLVTK
ncbi:MAG: DUF1800 family protein [Aquabacterium sp.]